jgi:Large polyvalent protein-associated domain 1
MAEKNIKTQVEERLVKQQESKEFKDIGRVANTKKEKSAYRLISSSILSQLEEDSVMAYNMVKKDNVWQPIDVNLEKERGVSSGAAYLKVKIREALPTRPKDEKQKRAAYVMFTEILQKDLFNCLTVKSIEQLVQSYSNFSVIETIGIFVNPEFITASVQRQEELKAEIDSNPKYRIFRYLSGLSLFRKLLNEVFGSRFENMLFNSSDASYVIYKDAREKESVSEEQASENISKLKESKEKFIKANLENIELYKRYSDSELIRKMNTDWQINPINQKIYKQSPNQFRDWVIAYIEKSIERGVISRDEQIKNSVAKDDDWSWFEQPKTRSESVKEKAQAINTKAPLAYIKRTGGYKIESIAPSSIIDNFGFSAVNYGVYVDDVWSKEHTKHFLGAMSDLGEMLNINLKQINNLGKLAIAFGAKGRPGHLATYFPQSKDINLTRGNGDGSLAHEWGHYFDNVIVELDAKLATNTFASEGKMPDYEIKELFKEFTNFCFKGNSNYTPLIPIQFYAKEISSAPTVVFKDERGNWANKVVEIKDTIEETLESVSGLAKLSGDLYRTQIRVYGYIIQKFNLSSYEIPMKLPTSYFYHKSAYSYFNYCSYTDNKTEKIDSKLRTKYWTSEVELFARAWETVVLKKLLDKNRASNYLVADIPMNDVISETYHVPYPQGKELEYIESIFDRIIIAVKNKFNIGPFIPSSNVREDVYLDLSNDKKQGKIETGMVVETPTEEKTEITFVKDDKVVEKVMEEANPYTDMNLQSVEDKAYSLGYESRKQGNTDKYGDSNIELQKIIKAGYAKNIIEKAFNNGWNKANSEQIDIDFSKSFTSSPKNNEIDELIIGLELLITDSNSEKENIEIKDIIDGLKLLN